MGPGPQTDTNAVGVLEKHIVILRCPISLFWAAHDVCAERNSKCGGLVYRFMAFCTQTNVMQTYPKLLEAHTLKLRVEAPHADSRARADMIKRIRPVIDLGYAKLWQ